jgi:hypothetical protein
MLVKVELVQALFWQMRLRLLINPWQMLLIKEGMESRKMNRVIRTDIMKVRDNCRLLNVCEEEQTELEA